jgi:hypothetical protein
MANEDTMTRAEHLAWAKQRALEILDTGDIAQAWASMVSDLHKHSELSSHIGLEMGNMMLVGGHFRTPKDVRDHIEGFN